MPSVNFRREGVYEGAISKTGHFANLHDAADDWPRYECAQPPYPQLAGDRWNRIESPTFISILQTRYKLET